MDVTLDAAVQDERHQQLLHVALLDVQLARDEGDADARVRLDQLQHHLRGRLPLTPGGFCRSLQAGITTKLNKALLLLSINQTPKSVQPHAQ